MAGEIRQKIVLEGEKEYNAALKEAQRHLKTLRSELKAETAELGANATAQQKNEVRAKSLQAQIKEQEEVVKTLRQALEEAKEHYGDNEEVVAKWEQKLNDARTTLANMKNDLSGLNDNFANVQSTVSRSTTDVKSFADTLGEIGDIGSSVSGAIEGVFSGLVSRIREAAAEIWDLIVDTAAAADNYGDLASYFGSSAYDVQKWSRAIEAAGGDLNTLTGIVTRLAYGGKNDKIAEYFGISDANYTDDLQYTLDVLTRMSEVQDEMKSKGTWNEAIAEIFGGKKAQDVQWFLDNLPGPQGILAWAEKYESEGWGNTEEELQNLGDIYKQVTDIQTKWNDLKAQWAAGFGEITGKLLVDVQGILGDLNAVLNAKDQGERDAALQALREHLESFFTTLAEAISEGIKQLNEVGKELQESTDPTVRAIGDLLVWITDKLTWLADPANKDAIIKTFEAIAAFWLTGKGLSLAMTIAEIVKNIALIKAFGTGSAVTGVVSGVGAGAAGTGAGVGLIAPLKTAVSASLPELAGATVAVGGIVGLQQILKAEDYKYEDEYEEGRFDAEELARINQMMSAMTKAYSLGMTETATEKDVQNATDEMTDAMAEFIESAGSAEEFFSMFEMSNGRNLLYDMLTSGAGYSGTLYDMLAQAFGDNDWKGWGLSKEHEKEWEGLNDAWAKQAAGFDTLYGWKAMSDIWMGLMGHLSPYAGHEDTPLGFDFWDSAPYQANQQQNKEYDNATLGPMIQQSVRQGMNGIKVEIDGQEAGRILMPWVSQYIGREVEAYAQ